MPETKIPANNARPYKITTGFFSGFGLACLDFTNRLLVLFNLKDSKRFWGIVYDSVSKQPLDPVIVKLVYTDGYEIEQAITDLGGGYGFLARKGKFKIFPHKSNYTFPSNYVQGDRDGVYENLYHGEFFVVDNDDGDDEVVAPNIPMDPQNFDWNQKDKQRVLNTYPYLRLFFRRLLGVLFWFGFIFTALRFWASYQDVSWYIYFILGVYVILVFLAGVLPEPRLLGKIVVRNSDLSAEKLFLQLHRPQLPGVRFGSARVSETGKFLLRANKGSYALSVSSLGPNKEENLLGSVKVKIGSTGVFNGSVIIDI